MIINRLLMKQITEDQDLQTYRSGYYFSAREPRLEIQEDFLKSNTVIGLFWLNKMIGGYTLSFNIKRSLFGIPSEEMPYFLASNGLNENKCFEIAAVWLAPDYKRNPYFRLRFWLDVAIRTVFFAIFFGKNRMLFASICDKLHRKFEVYPFKIIWDVPSERFIGNRYKIYLLTYKSFFSFSRIICMLFLRQLWDGFGSKKEDRCVAPETSLRKP
jgi:hypothetical protein